VGPTHYQVETIPRPLGPAAGHPLVPRELGGSGTYSLPGRDYSPPSGSSCWTPFGPKGVEGSGTYSPLGIASSPPSELISSGPKGARGSGAFSTPGRASSCSLGSYRFRSIILFLIFAYFSNFLPHRSGFGLSLLCLG
jgi:hypothetical protein